MTMPRMLLITLLLPALLLPGFAAPAADRPAYNYIPAAELEKRLKAEEKIFILDIQAEEDFEKHHIKGAAPTHAYPVQTEGDKAKLDAVAEQMKNDSGPVVVVCPRGAGGATRTVDFLVSRGVDPQRLFILEKGQSGWSCAELTEGK